MSKLEVATHWLREWLEGQEFKPLAVALFGSAARGCENPGDYDVLIVVEPAEDARCWRQIRRFRSQLVKDGSRWSEVPFHPLVLTTIELHQMPALKVVKAPFVIIKGSLAGGASIRAKALSRHTSPWRFF